MEKPTKINCRHIVGLFIETFEGDRPFTPAQIRMMNIHLKNVRKDVGAMLESGELKTNKGVNEIVYDAIIYAKMVGKKFRSVASLGYGVIPESEAYWEKRKEIEARQEQLKREEEEKKKLEEKYMKKVDEGIEKGYNKNVEKKKKPKWLDSGEEW